MGGKEPDPRDRADFRTTRWSQVVAAGDSAHPDFRPALASLCETYWFPVYAYLRRRGCDPDAARDLTQGFFCTVLEKRSLSVADPERGRFRSFLLRSVQYYYSHERERERAQKRGGRDAPVTLDLDVETAEGRYRREPVDTRTPEHVFTRRWALTLLDRTKRRLRDEMIRSGKSERFEALACFLTDDGTGTPYSRVAAELEMSEQALKVAIHRLRKRYGQLLREEVGHTVDAPERVDEEIRFLFEAME